MASLHPDLLLLAAVAWEYDERDIADTLYALAQASSHLTPPMEAADVQLGLQLCGIDTFHLVGPGLDVPGLVWDALDRGHVVLAQVKAHPLRKRDYWCALCEPSPEGWRGLALTADWFQCSVSSDYEARLTGHYVIAVPVLPEWEASLDIT
jgi:hypothetical protein